MNEGSPTVVRSSTDQEITFLLIKERATIIQRCTRARARATQLKFRPQILGIGSELLGVCGLRVRVHLGRLIRDLRTLETRNQVGRQTTDRQTL